MRLERPVDQPHSKDLKYLRANLSASSDHAMSVASNAAPGSTVAEGIAMLKRGCVATKYGRKGLPHQATFTLSDDESTIVWEDTTRRLKDLVPGKGMRDRSIRVSDIADLVLGGSSSVFQRFEAADTSLCLSLLTAVTADAGPRAGEKRDATVLTPKGGAEQRLSLDVRLDDEILYAQFAAAMTALIAATHAKSEAAAESERRASALARSAPQLADELARRDEAVLAAKLAEAEQEAERWMAAKAQAAVEAMSADVSKQQAEATAMNEMLKGGSVKRQTELRVRLRLLAERDPAKWSVFEMKAALAVGGVSLDLDARAAALGGAANGKAELQKMTKALARAAHAQWEAEEAAEEAAAAAAMAAAEEEPADKVDEEADLEEDEEAEGMDEVAALMKELDEEEDDDVDGEEVEEGDAAAPVAAQTKNMSALQRARAARTAARQASLQAAVAKATKAWTTGTKNKAALNRARLHRQRSGGAAA